MRLQTLALAAEMNCKLTIGYCLLFVSEKTGSAKHNYSELKQ